MTPEPIPTSRPGPSERILACDLGKRRTGLALGSLDSGLATPHSTVELSFPALIDHLRELAAEEGATWVLIGDPTLPSGDQSEIGAYARRVARALEEAGLRVLLWEEGLTSWEAERILRERRRPKRSGPGGGTRSGRAGDAGCAGGQRRRPGPLEDPGEIDRVAAALLLQDYLDHQRRVGPPDGPGGPHGQR